MHVGNQERIAEIFQLRAEEGFHRLALGNSPLADEMSQDFREAFVGGVRARDEGLAALDPSESRCAHSDAKNLHRTVR